MKKIWTRMGDGSPVEFSPEDLRGDLEEGTRAAAEAGKIAPLDGTDIDYLVDLFSTDDKFVSVARGREVVLSYDGATIKMHRAGVSTNRIQSIQVYEKLLGADTLELAHIDYSYKPIKPILGYELPVMEQALLVTHAPLFYGAMPNLGLYSQPDGPFPNPAELMPQGRLDEAFASHEAAVDAAVEDIVFVAENMHQCGVDGVNLDTTGAAGDPDFLAALKATAILRERCPDLCIELGMAGEFVLGMHGSLTWDGVRLAGLYPHQAVKLAEKAGATIFGPVVNTNADESTPWNVARAVTFVRACADVATIPVHANVGMGVGGVTITDHPPLDVVSRASTALVELTRLDGL